MICCMLTSGEVKSITNAISMVCIDEYYARAMRAMHAIN
jgi:hypothetical protein